MYFVYLLQCADNSIYTGVTTNVERRFEEHKKGTASHYTSAKKAVRILYSEKQPNRSEAQKREAEIKKWSREKKLALVRTAKMIVMEKKVVTKKAMTVSAYVKMFPKPVATRLATIRALVKKGAPNALEGVWYGMPGYKINGKPLIYFGAFKNHTGVFPTPSGITALKKELASYTTAKGSIQFPHTAPLPMTLIKKIIATRIKALKEK
jgi:predicted GIY-YIG superfamily endonuclease/uncharacterized protein YdhG (YjbR/CyaY superfamily)